MFQSGLSNNFQYYWSISSDSNGTVKEDLSKKDTSVLKLSPGSLQGGSVYNFTLSVIVEDGIEIKDEFFLSHSQSNNFKKSAAGKSTGNRNQNRKNESNTSGGEDVRDNEKRNPRAGNETRPGPNKTRDDGAFNATSGNSSQEHSGHSNRTEFAPRNESSWSNNRTLAEPNSGNQTHELQHGRPGELNKTQAGGSGPSGSGPSGSGPSGFGPSGSGSSGSGSSGPPGSGQSSVEDFGPRNSSVGSLGPSMNGSKGGVGMNGTQGPPGAGISNGSQGAPPPPPPPHKYQAAGTGSADPNKGSRVPASRTKRETGEGSVKCFLLFMIRTVFLSGPCENKLQKIEGQK